MYKLVNSIFLLAEIILIARVIVSWLPLGRPGRYDRYVDFLYRITEPVLAPIRNLISRSPLGGLTYFDLSPLVVFLLISMVRNAVIGSLPM